MAKKKIIFRSFFSVEKKIFTFHYLPFARQQPKHIGKRRLSINEIVERKWNIQGMEAEQEVFTVKNHRWERETNSSLLIFHNKFSYR